jgi:uncharacterized membrane protein YeaQ/YmgE (transglycosylase-associated protein family)
MGNPISGAMILYSVTFSTARYAGWISPAPSVIVCGLSSAAEWSRACIANQNRRDERMGIISWILFGLVVGIIAKLLMPGRDPGGFIITILLGIAGALIGGFIGRAMGFYGPDEAAGWIISILGAIVLLALYRMMVRRRV